MQISVLTTQALLGFCLISGYGLAEAGCVIRGDTYPEGAVVGNKICSNGQWISTQPKTQEPEKEPKKRGAK